MELTDKVSLVLREKGPKVWSVPSNASVYEAVELMADKDIGALAVVDDGELIGIFSERDYARKIVLLGKSSRQTSVSEIMSHPVIHVSLSDTVDECLRVMTYHRTRHLLVVDKGSVSGILSIGDLVNWIISAQAETIGNLHSYITGRYPA
jgi:CBS domain-containing protein